MASKPDSSDDSIGQLLSARQFVPMDRSTSTGRKRPSDTQSTTPQKRRVPFDPSAHEETANAAIPEDPATSRRSSLRKNAGRPILQPNQNPVLSEDRRKQIRRAQKTYRLKKEASLQKTQTRLAELEGKLGTIVKFLDEFYDASLAADLNVTHPTLFQELNSLHALVASGNEASNEPTYRKPHERHENMRDLAPRSEMHDHSTDLPEKPGCGSNPLEANDMYRPVRMIGKVLGSKHYTYAFQETDFSRSLQRYCLEHAFRLFSDPLSHPQEVYRVFRLVPCMKEKEKMYPYFQRLVAATSHETLEICSLPFYTIGGAGTHYPVKDDLGNPVYPQNMRLPKRILGLFSKLNTLGMASTDEAQRHLELCGYGGEWFDCNDVEGYLREQGVRLEGSSLFPAVATLQPCPSSVTTRQMGRADDQAVGDPHMLPPLDTLPASSAPKSISNGTANGYDIYKAGDGSETISLTKPASPTVLNIESFFARLLRGVVILGRAPGFRRSDVVRAFKACSLVQGRPS